MSLDTRLLEKPATWQRKKRKPVIDKWAVYSQLKAQLPPMEPAFFAQECRRIAKELGL